MADVNILDLNFLGLEHTISSFLVKTEAGPLLIETGPHSSMAALERELRKHGLVIGDIKHVFLTHIHLDHAGAAWCFAESGAKIYVHPLGKKHLASPEKLMESARRIYQDQMDYLWGQMKGIPEDQLIEVGHDEVIKVGNVELKALHTPGHAIHHIAWKVGDEVFSGDVAGVKIDDGPVVPPCPPPDINLEDWKQSLQILTASGAVRLYLTHFGKVDSVFSHLHQLEEELDVWTDWIRKKMLAGMEAPEMTPVFQEFVADRLKMKGLTDGQIQQYEAANPAWMSVAGLVRYWKKRERQD